MKIYLGSDAKSDANSEANLPHCWRHPTLSFLKALEYFRWQTWLHLVRLSDRVVGKAKDNSTRTGILIQCLTEILKNLKQARFYAFLFVCLTPWISIQSVKLRIFIGQTFYHSKLNHIHSNLTFVQRSSLLISQSFPLQDQCVN